MRITDLTDSDYLERIKSMDLWLSDVRQSDHQASLKYLDLNMQSTGQFYDDDDRDYQEKADLPDWVPIGQTNYIAINNETKMAAIAKGTPLMHVKANEDPEKDGVANAGEIVAQAWQQSWKKHNWKREFKACAQKLGIIGLGMIWYRWDSRYGPCFEHLPYKRLLLDPNANNLLRMEMGGVIVFMTVRTAIATYDPDEAKGLFTKEYTGFSEKASLDRKLVKIYIYQDRDTEVHAYNDEVIHKEENLYKEICLLPIESFIDPRDRLLPLGDNVFAQGLGQSVYDLTMLATRMAKHGGQITLADNNYFDTQTKQQLEQGVQQGIIFTKKALNPQALPVHRIAAEQLSPAYGEAITEQKIALDGIMGTTPAQRGQQLPNVTATQSVMVENRAGARPTEVQEDFETLITRSMEAYVSMMKKFGGPTESDPGTEETRVIWQAFKAVYQVSMVEGSASFEPPAADKQSAMQSYTTMMQSIPMWLQYSQAGLTQEIPNMKQWANDLIMAFKKQNQEQYWTKAPPPQQGPPPPTPDALVRALSVVYKDSGPDAKLQILQDFGLNASQMEQPPEEGAEGPEGLDPAQASHDMAMQQDQQQHEAAMETIKQQHEKQLKWWDIKGKLEQARMKPKPAAKPAAKPKAKK